jgi:ribonuclease P protein component
VLPRAARVRTPADHRLIARRGQRATAGPLSVRLLAARDARSPGPVRVGVVVPKPVGTAVQRNIIRRRLRHLLASRLDELPAGALLVVRAESPAAFVPSATLAASLDLALRRLPRRSRVVAP